MTTGRKRWWRAAAIAAVGGVAVTGGWLGLVRAKGPARPELPETTDWTRASAPSPTVAEVGRTAAEPAPATGIVQAGAVLPPLPSVGASAVAPAVPVSSPVVVPAAPLPVPALPSVPAVPPAPIEPVSGPRANDAGLTGGDKSALPIVPAVPTLPAFPPVALPAPTPPKAPDTKPVAPPMPAAPALPALPSLPGTGEPPVAPTAVAPLVPAAPAALPLPSPAPLAPSAPPAKPTDPVQPMIPAKPDSGLKPTAPGNNLNPTVAPAVPVMPPMPNTGRDVPALPVDRSKVPEPSFIAPTDKDVFPVKPVAPDTRATTPRDDTMLNLTTTAAFAVLGSAMLAVEKANPPTLPPKAVTPMTTAVPLKADDADVTKLKTDLAAANRKIEDLEKQVKRLNELLTGKKDELGVLVDPKAPGAVDDVKALKDKIAAMQREIDSLKTQTALKPAVVPEVKPKGTVRVVNEYPVEISMVINDKSYRIAPGAKLDVDVSAGDFSYQLLQSGAAATKSVIKDKETVTLRIK